MRLSKLHLENLLSFRDAQLCDLGPVSLLIGPNASGKTNLLDALSLLQAAPDNLGAPISRGGIRDWIWRGQDQPSPVARIECDLEIAESRSPLRYSLAIQEAEQAFFIPEEKLVPLHKGARPLFARESGRVIFGGAKAAAVNGGIGAAKSALSVFRDPAGKPELTAVGKAFEAIRIYRNFDTSTGPRGGARFGVSASYLPVDQLDEDGYNLALVLSRMALNGSIEKVQQYLHEFCDRYGKVQVDPKGGIARLFIREQGLRENTPGVRLSDGTLKLLCLLAVFFNTESPPSVVCIDEPETGLHPDAVRLLAGAIREASSRTQLIIATHSDALVDEFSDNPEAVVVCEADASQGTQFKRLSRKQLKSWLADYSLGELWRKGTIGGNPW